MTVCKLLVVLLARISLIPSLSPFVPIAQSAGAVEYTDCFSAEG